MQAQATICPRCFDDHQPPCSTERLERTIWQQMAEEADLRTTGAPSRMEEVMWARMIIRIAELVKDLRTRIAELEKDRERLDWLEEHAGRCIHHGYADKFGVVWQPDPGARKWSETIWMDSFREAIDAAREGE